MRKDEGNISRTWIIIQIGLASALAPDHGPGGVTWADELRGAARIQVVGARRDGTICRRDDHHRDVEPIYDGHYVHVPHSVQTFSDEGRGELVKTSRRTIVKILIPVALKRPFRHRRGRYTLHGAQGRGAKGRQRGCVS
jgi:hypothetical protein